MEGPRGVRKEDLPSLRALTDTVMRVGLVDQFVQLFNEANFSNLMVCVEDGKCVTHVGMTQNGAVLYGCPIRVACIGGVCTNPEYRKQGLASACFDAAFQKAHDDGVDIMIVSGDRNLYRMRGCVHVGKDMTYSLTEEDVPNLSRNRLVETTIDVMKPDELALVAECYREEPARFARSPEDYGYALQSDWVMNGPSDFLVIRERGDFRGYVIAPRRNDRGKTSVAEYAGDRRAILAAMPLVFEHMGMGALGFHVLRHDALMRSLCEQAGLQGTNRTTPGTVTLVNFPQFMERMRPYFVERLGTRIASDLRFSVAGDRYLFEFGNEQLEFDRSDACRTIFGTLEPATQYGAEWQGELGETLRTILPLPTLHYGINYV